MEFEGKVAFVSGAARGIGRATALAFAQGGADVAVADLGGPELEAVRKECEGLGVRALALEFDQGDSAQVEAAFARIVEELGRCDIVANVAGIFPFASILETSDELWRKVMDTNLSGVFYCSRAALRIMKDQGGGCIVNIASGAGIRGLPTLGAYAASKAGVIGLTRVLALEGAPEVRVNVVAPGPTNTQGGSPDQRAGAPGEGVTQATAAPGIPLGRMGTPEEVAEAITFLASTKASFIHGQVIHVNGGLIMP